MKEYKERKPLPPFLDEEEVRRFLPILDTHFIIPSKFEEKDVWVSNSGLCFSGLHFYSESTYRFAYPLFRYKLQCIYNWVFRKKVILEGKALLVHTPWSIVNYHHWLVDCLPRFYPFLSQIDTVRLLLPKQLEEVPFVQATLLSLNIRDVWYIPQDHLVKVKQLSFAEQTPGSYYVNDHLKPMIDLLKRRSHCEEAVASKRIFLSRQSTGYRKIENYEQLKIVLAKYNFEIIEAEKWSFQDQIMLFSSTKYLVSVHGAGLTNCVFMPTGGKVFELHPDVSRQRSIFNYIYWNLANHFGLAYYFLGCEPVDKQERFHTANLEVDLEKMESILNAMISD